MTISEKDPVRDADPSVARASGIDPVRMAIALEVFEELDELPVDHPQADRGAPRHRTSLQDGQAAQPQGEAGSRRRC